MALGPEDVGPIGNPDSLRETSMLPALEKDLVSSGTLPAWLSRHSPVGLVSSNQSWLHG